MHNKSNSNLERLPDGKIALFQNKLYYQNNIQLSTSSDINNIQSQINNLNTTISNINNANVLFYGSDTTYSRTGGFEITLPQNVSAYNNLYMMCESNISTSDAYMFYDKSTFMVMHNQNNYLCSIHKLNTNQYVEERVKYQSDFATEVTIMSPRNYNKFMVFFENLSTDLASYSALIFTIA